MKEIARRLACSAAQQSTPRGGGARCRSCQERTWVEATGQEVEESELWVDLGGLNSQLGDMEWYNGLRQYLFVFEIFTLFLRRSIHLSIYPSFKKIYLSCWGWKVNSVFRATAKLRGQNFGEAGLRTELQGGWKWHKETVIRALWWCLHLEGAVRRLQPGAQGIPGSKVYTETVHTIYIRSGRLQNSRVALYFRD